VCVYIYIYIRTIFYNILYIVNTPTRFDASAEVDADASKPFCFLGEHSVIQGYSK